MTENIDELQRKLNVYEKQYGPLIEKRGAGNVKNLFKKPTGSQWLVFFMLVMILLMSYLYAYDTKTCREYVASFQQEFNNLTNNSHITYPNYNTSLNLSGLNALNGGNSS